MADERQAWPMAPPIAAPPRRARSRGDVAAGVVLWTGLGLGLLLKLMFAGLVMLWLLWLLPVLVGVPVAGAIVLNGVLLRGWPRGRSWSVAPAHYRLLAWVLGVGSFLAGSAMIDVVHGDEVRSAWAALLGQEHAPQTPEVALRSWGFAALAAVVAVVWFVIDLRAARRQESSERAALG